MGTDVILVVWTRHLYSKVVTYISPDWLLGHCTFLFSNKNSKIVWLKGNVTFYRNPENAETHSSSSGSNLEELSRT